MSMTSPRTTLSSGQDAPLGYRSSAAPLSSLPQSRQAMFLRRDLRHPGRLLRSQCFDTATGLGSATRIEKTELLTDRLGKRRAMFIGFVVQQTTNYFYRIRLNQGALYLILLSHPATITGMSYFVQCLLRASGRLSPISNLVSPAYCE